MNPIVSYISPQWWRINTYKHCMNNVLPSVTKKLKIREEKYTTECCEVGLQKDFHEKIFNHLWAILCLIPSMFEVVTTLCTLIRVQLDNVDNMKSHLEKSSITLITGSWRSTYHLFDFFFPRMLFYPCLQQSPILSYASITRHLSHISKSVLNHCVVDIKLKKYKTNWRKISLLSSEFDLDMYGTTFSCTRAPYELNY